MCAAGDGIDAGVCDMLGLSSPSGTGLEKFYKFYGDQDSQSAPVRIDCDWVCPDMPGHVSLRVTHHIIL